MSDQKHRCKCTEPGHCWWHKAVTTREEFVQCRQGPPPKPSDPPPCVYLGEEHRRDQVKGQQVYACRLHGKCTLQPNQKAVAACADCKDYLTEDAPNFAKRFVDPLLVTDRHKNPTAALRDLLTGCSAFLVCGGPSINEVRHELLADRGVFSLGVNNVAGHVRTSAFLCSDPPMKFHHGIFADPKVMKLLPTPKLGRSSTRGKLREKRADGKFHWLPWTVMDCPNVWGFNKRGWLMPDGTFFAHPWATLGNLDAGVRQTGQPKTSCTMLQGFRLLYHMGVRQIFLLGVDFRMRSDVGERENYAFGEKRNFGAVRSNNSQYEIVAEWLRQLRPVFERYGLHVYNCNPFSHLRAFDHVPFETAYEICRGEVPLEPWDLGGFYEKSTEKE